MTREVPYRLGVLEVGWLRMQELPQLAAIERMVFPEPLSLTRLIPIYSRPRARCLVARDGRTVAAYFGWEEYGREGHVLSNATHPRYRGRGLAHHLLSGAELYASRAGIRWFLGEVRVSNAPQLTVLDSLGWIRVTQIARFFGNGEDAFLVLRVLQSPPRS